MQKLDVLTPNRLLPIALLGDNGSWQLDDQLLNADY